MAAWHFWIDRGGTFTTRMTDPEVLELRTRTDLVELGAGDRVIIETPGGDRFGAARPGLRPGPDAARSALSREGREALETHSLE